MTIDAQKVLAGVPAGLRDALIDEFRGISDAIAQGKWKAASLDAGRFCEVVFSILDGALSGKFPASPSKPSNFPKSCRDLENRTPIQVGDHSIRILIPRVLSGMYDVRNNRNVGHVGGDVIANHMDATLVHANASWILAELIRVFHAVSIPEAQRTVDGLVERRSQLIWAVNGRRRVLNTELNASDKSLLLMYDETNWLTIRTLCDWIQYSNLSAYRARVIRPLSTKLLVEFDKQNDSVIISPTGIRIVENRVLPNALI